MFAAHPCARRRASDRHAAAPSFSPTLARIICVASAAGEDGTSAALSAAGGSRQPVAEWPERLV